MKLRPVLLQMHLYVGLTIGLLLAVMGLSGSALVFGDELDRRLHPELLRVEPRSERVPLATVLAAVAASHGPAQPRYLRLPARPDQPIEAWMDTAGSLKVYVDPYTGAVLGARTPWDSLAGALRALHVFLFAGESGKNVVGVCGLLLIALCASGMVLWWPGRGKLAQGLAVRRPLRLERGSFDLHRLSGVLSLGGLLIAGVTGVSLVFHRVAERALYAITGTPPRPAPPTGVASGTPLPIDVLIHRAEAALPGGTTTFVYLPTTREAPLKIRKRLPGEIHPNGMSFVHLDRGTGRPLLVENALAAPLAARLYNLRYPLHTGRFGGPWTGLLAVLVGLMPAGLYVSGFLLWLSRARRANSRRPAPMGEPVALRSR